MKTLISTLKNGKTDFFALLSKRMDEKGDFPAFSRSVQLLEESIHSDTRNITDITSAILNDFALTQKVIKLANSAMYSAMGKKITTVTHATAILGLDAIANLSLSTRLIDALSSSAPDSEHAHEELENAILAGKISENIVAKLNMSNGEEAVVCTLLHHLGRLLLTFYFPDEWSKIKEISADKMTSENEAVLSVIGITTDEIAQTVADKWWLPKKISNSMSSSASPDKPVSRGSSAWLKNIANFAREAATITKNTDNHDELNKLFSKYEGILQLSNNDLLASITSTQKLANEPIPKSTIEQPQGKPKNSHETLSTGIQEINLLLAQGISFNSALSIILETIYSSMGFNRVCAFLRDAGMFKAKIGYGNGMPEILPQLVFPEVYSADVFHLSLSNKADVFIEEVSTVKESASIPFWYRKALPDAATFILLPLVSNNEVVGLIYADWEIGMIEIVEPSELTSMGALRDNLTKLLIN